jgi:pimeloyl-ACP methyl ester carboxylesterase
MTLATDTMQLHVLRTPAGHDVSYVIDGQGPVLALVHGGFSNERTNWEFVWPLLREQFTLVAVARRGRGLTAATTGHSIGDESHDVASVIELFGEPVYLLGHSYGAHCALGAARLAPDRVRKLALYEPPRPDIFSRAQFQRWESVAAAGDWDGFAWSFFRDGLRVPDADLQAYRDSALWPDVVADAPATLGDLRALDRYWMTAEDFRGVDMPVLLQTGTESPADLYWTDELARVLPRATVEPLAGQAHEGMTTAPDLYAESVLRFCRG